MCGKSTESETYVDEWADYRQTRKDPALLLGLGGGYTLRPAIEETSHLPKQGRHCTFIPKIAHPKSFVNTRPGT